MRNTNVHGERSGRVTRSGLPGAHDGTVLAMPSDTRERLIDYYRARDEEDATRVAAGEQRGRSCVWETCLRRLESGEDAYETYRVLAAAGIEVPAESQAVIARLQQDWQQICHIDSAGVVRTASVKARARARR